MVRYSSETAAARPRHFLRQLLKRLYSSVIIARLLFLANLRAKHRRALIGYAWLVVPGLATALIFALLRKASIFATGSMDIPYPLFVLSGMYLWQSFADALTLPIQHLKQQRAFLAVVPAPHEAILLASIGEVLLGMLVRIGLLLGVAFLFAFPPAPTWALVPFAFLIMAAIGFACCLLISPIAQIYDDISALLGIMTSFGFFLVPVIFTIPENSILTINPMVPVMDLARAWMFGGAGEHSVVSALAFVAIALPIGWAVSAVAQPHIAAQAG